MKFQLTLSSIKLSLKTNTSMKLVDIYYHMLYGSIIFARQNLGNRKRLWYSYIFKNGTYRERRNKVPFKHNVSWAKGAVHIASTRAFVDYQLHSEIGKVSRNMLLYYGLMKVTLLCLICSIFYKSFCIEHI